MSARKTAIHGTKLTEDTSGPLLTERNFYRRELGRLLIEGHENRWVLIKGEQIVGIWDTREEAADAADEREFPQPFLVRQILEWEFADAPLVPESRDTNPRRGAEAHEVGEQLAKQGKAIHWTKLTAETSGPLATEWNCYLRELGRLLAEGHEGRWLLIKGDELVGIWDTYEEASAVATERYFRQPVFVHRILTHEPLIRLPYRWHLWHNSRSQS